MSQPIDITLNVNGRTHRLNVPPRRILADLLRDQLQLTGCKMGCDQAVCGACTVLVDGMPATACTTFAFEVDGKPITRSRAWPPVACWTQCSAPFSIMVHFNAASARRR
jgi:aerobic-type carbon monoxide dehydrogenase small subunit (CoxS/CutS family)